MIRYRKKPVVVEAWQWLGSGFAADAPGWVKDYKCLGGNQVRPRQDDKLDVPTLEGKMVADVGDWIIQGVKGEVYPCKPDIFEATYEKAEAQEEGNDATL